jgi:plastocyanin
LAQLGPKATIAGQENTPEMEKLPSVFPDQFPTKGFPEVNHSASEPCFMASGVPANALTGNAAACPKVAQPDFDGTQSFYNSGLLQEDGANYTVKLAANTKPGAYSLMCMVHRAVMTAKITVVDASQSVPSDADQTAHGQQQFGQLVTALAPVAAAAETPNGTTVQAGLGDPKDGIFNALVTQFGPKTISIPVGGTVTWPIFSFHSISFGFAASDAGAAILKAADGTFHLNPKGGPIGVNTPPAAFDFPPPDNGKPILINGGRWNGTGQRSIGIIGSLPPVFITFKQTFTKAGTYTYRCLFHVDMEGTVKVG